MDNNVIVPVDLVRACNVDHENIVHSLAIAGVCKRKSILTQTTPHTGTVFSIYEKQEQDII